MEKHLSKRITFNEGIEEEISPNSSTSSARNLQVYGLYNFIKIKSWYCCSFEPYLSQQWLVWLNLQHCVLLLMPFQLSSNNVKYQFRDILATTVEPIENISSCGLLVIKPVFLKPGFWNVELVVLKVNIVFHHKLKFSWRIWII